eukprot:1261284-Amphidinium_carterae.1
MDVLKTAVSEAYEPRNAEKTLENTCFGLTGIDWKKFGPLGPGSPPGPPPACCASDPKALKP